MAKLKRVEKEVKFLALDDAIVKDRKSVMLLALAMLQSTPPPLMLVLALAMILQATPPKLMMRMPALTLQKPATLKPLIQYQKLYCASDSDAPGVLPIR